MLPCSIRRPGKGKKKKGGAKGKKGFGAMASAGYGSSSRTHGVPMAARAAGRAAGMGRASRMAYPTWPASACVPCIRLAGARCPVARQQLRQGLMGKLRLL